MVGGIIPLRRATSFRYDGRLEQESAAVANLSFSGAFFDIIYWPLRDKFFGDEDRVAKFGGPNDVLCGDPVSIIGLFRLHPELFTPGMWQHFPMPASASRSWMRQAIKLRPKPILWRRRPLRV